MKMTLLHAFAVILTMLLFVVRQQCALPSISSGKWRSIQLQASQLDSRAEQPVQSRIVECAQDFFLTNPKYKRDPDIDVDNEKIGSYPMG